MALTVKMMSSGDVMLTYVQLATAVAALRVSVGRVLLVPPQARRVSLRLTRLLLCLPRGP
ncbi:hypothetical protein GAR06_00594 [Micromonospora saelicesensis]|uniref:Uncharacterized protein n=2 Tax=Micromonospora saelicesensis TaxID=285676 RepID=A0ABX9CLZ0_9ACTN|nr:hypothetical protein GAR05_01461 [Micromonospora saelicesensis]RAO50081.1 hypothetical protein GAR06_00594 [Micromonospora saelicesensis]RAO57198.1 hypothetical protein LUPAC06_03386 [Micromonospora saelicesensis]RAO61032.1 hypothetical protein PSN01_01940 [Micromonospora saelicesensis]